MGSNISRIGFGGGCHWCTEAVFQTLCGVAEVEQGFARSVPPADNWSEAVTVYFDPRTIDLATLIEVHLRTHASTKKHALRSKYRSAVYAVNSRQAQEAESVLHNLNAEFGAQLITCVLHFDAFKLSDPRVQNYYRSDPRRPFCRRYIDPKLALIRAQFGAKDRAQH